MSLIAIGNVVVVTVFMCLALSYFWSHWTFKVFKPHMWLERHRSKQIHADVERIERRTKDKNRFYNFWFLLEQLDANMTTGDVAVIGVENVEIPRLCQLSGRTLWVLDTFEKKVVNRTKENCNGEVKNQDIALESVTQTAINQALEQSERCHVIKGDVLSNLSHICSPLALASIDSVDYDEVLQTLQVVYNQLVPGGMIVVHDYNHSWPEVHAAVDRFQASVPENFVALSDMYGSAVLIRNSKR